MEATGERWFAKPTTFEEDMKDLWGDWGCDSEIGTLRAVLVRRPGREIENVDPARARFRAPVDPERARAQHDALCGLYREHGVAVHYVERMGEDRPNGYFVRDLVAMTPEGAILARPALEVRRGEERYVAETLARLGVPIIRTVAGAGTFEGADLMWLDRKTAFLGLGNRSNAEGLRQVAEELRRMGVEEIVTVQHSFGGVHLDGIFNIADRDVVVLFPWQTPFVVYEVFKRRGFRIIEVNDVREAKERSAANFVALAPGRVVVAQGAPRTAEALSRAGVEVIEIDVSELQKGWGSLHCMTAFLKRDSL